MRILLLCLIAIWFGGVASAERIALLVGNAGYGQEVGELDNPHNDIAAIRSALLDAGFAPQNIKVVKDTSRIELLREVTRFAERAETLTSNDIAFFYYSGHGARRPLGNGMSLIPTDVRTVDNEDFWFETIDLNSEIIQTFVGPKGNRSPAAWVVAIDACRNELRLPQRALGGGSKSFGGVPTTSGMLISFAADTGETAADKVAGSTRLSPYAKVLSEELVKPGRSLSGIFNSVRPGVMQLTGRAQQPVITSKLNTDPVLIGATTARPGPDPESSMFLAAQTCADYRAYKNRYPNGKFKTPAETILASARCNPGEAETASSISAAEAREAASSGWNAYERKDYSTARALLQKGCDGGDARGCSNLGRIYRDGNGVSKDDARALTLFQKGCDGGVMKSCSDLGVLYDLGTGVTQDYTRARTLYESACDEGVSEACINLGVLYHLGNGVTRDYGRARALYQDACEENYAAACSYLGVLYHNGTGAAQNFRRARVFYQQGCDDGHALGCTRLGELVYAGLGGAEDRLSGIALVREGCAGSFKQACDWLDERELGR